MKQFDNLLTILSQMSKPNDTDKLGAICDVFVDGGFCKGVECAECPFQLEHPEFEEFKALLNEKFV